MVSGVVNWNWVPAGGGVADCGDGDAKLGAVDDGVHPMDGEEGLGMHCPGDAGSWDGASTR